MALTLLLVEGARSLVIVTGTTFPNGNVVGEAASLSCSWDASISEAVDQVTFKKGDTTLFLCAPDTTGKPRRCTAVHATERYTAQLLSDKRLNVFVESLELTDSGTFTCQVVSNQQRWLKSFELHIEPKGTNSSDTNPNTTTNSSGNNTAAVVSSTTSASSNTNSETLGGWTSVSSNVHPENKGLTAGQIAALVMGSVAGIAIFGILIFCMLKEKILVKVSLQKQVLKAT
nr:hypothetical protein BgiMline_021312 [Biomphalaria glabrata]